MGERQLYQPLTKEDRITVLLYRIGIGLSTLIITFAAYLSFGPSPFHYALSLNSVANILLILLSLSVGCSVLFIHLYVSRFHRALKKLYYVSIAALLLLFILGRGDAFGIIIGEPYGPLLLIPLSGCLGFITAKEAFCFRLTEGYLLALIMPLYLLALSMGGMTTKGASYGLLFIAAMLVFFTLRKVFMPIHYDIGDKSAYV
ncbi:MAG: DUF2301 domain-containing membrane protein [Nitrospirota bacterium]